MNAKCVNIHDEQSPVYELTNDYDGRRALTKNFFMLLESYKNHPEAKSLDQTASPAFSIHGDCYSEHTLLRTGRLSTLERNQTDTGKRAKIRVCWNSRLSNTSEKEILSRMTSNLRESPVFPNGN